MLNEYFQPVEVASRTETFCSDLIWNQEGVVFECINSMRRGYCASAQSQIHFRKALVLHMSRATTLQAPVTTTSQMSGFRRDMRTFERGSSIESETERPG